MGPPFLFNAFCCCWAGLRWAWWIEEKMEEYVERGQLRGWGSPGPWWQIKQKRPHATPRPALSPSPLTPVMGTGSLKWVATAKCIIFEMLSHKPSWPHIQLCLMLFMSAPPPPPSSLHLLCLIVCHLPAKWAARHGQAFHLSVRAEIDREWQHQKRKKRREKNGFKWNAQGQPSQRPLNQRLS